MLRTKRPVTNRLLRAFLPLRGNGHHPHLLRSTTVLLTLAFVFVIQLAFLAYETTLYRSGTNIAAVLPSAIALLTNEARADVLSLPLSINPILTEAAQKKADDMVSKGYFAHQEPSGAMPWHWFKEAGYNYVYAGENLAVNFSDSEQLMNAWLASPTHRDNIVKPQYTHIGIGMATGTHRGREAVFVVQFFGTTRASEPHRGLTSESELYRGLISESALGTTTNILAVLGEQTSIKSAAASWPQRIKDSPRTMNIRLLLGLLAVFTFLLAFSLMPRLPAHPRAIMNGFAVLAVLIFLLSFQNSFLGSLEISTDSQALFVSEMI